MINSGVSDPMRLFDKIKIFSCKDTDRNIESDLKSHQLNNKDELSSNLHSKTEGETPLLVVTSRENLPLNGIYCSYCEMKLAAYWDRKVIKAASGVIIDFDDEENESGGRELIGIRYWPRFV